MTKVSRNDKIALPNFIQSICGDYSEEDTPVPIPNTEVKLPSADDTWRATAWESRTLPVSVKKKTFQKSSFLVFAEPLKPTTSNAFRL